MERISFAISEGNLEGNRLTGIAHAYGQTTVRNGEIYTFAKGAFTNALQTSDVRAFINHDPNLLIGRQSAGTLTLTDTDEGLRYSIELPDTSYANDLKELVRRGDIDGASFGVIPGKSTVTKNANGDKIRTHTEVRELIDISPVSLPAFAGTSVQLNSKDGKEQESIKSQVTKARNRVRNK